MTTTDTAVVEQRPQPFNEDGSPDWAEIGFRLRQPFKNISQYKGRGGISFSYIDARQVMNRLDQVVGPGNWSDLYREVGGGGAIECMLTVCGVTKTDVGYSNTPDDGNEQEPLKAAYSDAFKRAAVKHGIGRFLYAPKP
jgi:hypothetical protein